MQSIIINQNFDNFLLLAITIAFFGVTFSILKNYSQFGNINITRLSQLDPTRVHEGLPTDLTLTPEDFRAHPELVEIFGVTDTNANLDVILESNEHFEAVQDQIAAGTYDSIMASYDVIFAFISSFFNF